MEDRYSHDATYFEQEDRFSSELQKQKKKEFITLKLRQHLRENNVELRELETKLRVAYIQKELVAQIAEKKYKKSKDKELEMKANEVIANAVMNSKEQEDYEKEQEIKKKYAYKKELQDQMIIKYREQQNRYEDFLREKKMLDEVIQQIYDEDVRELENKMCKMKKTKAEIDAFRASQKIWKEKEKVELEEENRRIVEYLQNKELEEQLMKQRKSDDRAARDKQIEEIAKKMYIQELQKKERAEILQDLLIEETREKEAQNLKAKFKKQLQERIEMENAHARQLEERKEKLRQEELEEAHYKQQMLEQKMEDEKLEQLSAEKRRRKMIEFRREIQDHIKERQVKRAEELRALLYNQEQEKINEEKKKKIIEEERIRLLREHAYNLIGYLPSGVLKPDDIPYLGSKTHDLL